MRVLVEARQLGCDRPAQQVFGELDHGDPATEGAGTGRDLEPDESAADHHHVTGGPEPPGEVVGLGQGSQGEDPIEVGALDLERAGGRAGRQGQARKREGTTGCRSRGAAGGVSDDLDDLVTGDEVDLLVLEPSGLTQEDRGPVVFAPEVGLRQQRSLVGRLGLVTDEGDALVVAQLTQPRHEGEAGLARADDERAG